MNIKLAVVFWILFGFLTGALEAQSVALRLKLGVFAPRFESVLWEENLETFAIEPSDFDALIGGVEFSIELSDYVDLAFGVETSSSTVFSNYRDFVFDDGGEIFQDLTLRTTPVTAGVLVFPIGKLHRVLPYVTGGGGLYVYEYREEGEFVDFDTFDIYGDLFFDRGVGYGGYLGAGVEVRVSELAFIFGEYRRHWARGSHGGDFQGFGRFDLRANQLSFGVNLRF
jgi:hypothetical protein